ncbi:glucose-1-phosphate thymidylyltransferase [Streptomyces chartreusis]|uniref:ChaS1 n=1 Tax=Streptomyces chartreusis TaxID=1969 RepID=A0A346RP09_STRCX|nr:glucose-1-phosphate thymidylyltransferase [Streptomyces chartreusis]AXS67806.1 ChaS1 [Streptomyces chartreusis]QKZ16800.1 glucose-1-phosphate thymidylyltransferase [Streptomyces chartreusis]
MKALVLAGGMGIRLRPLSHTTAKQLIPVGGEPVVRYILDVIREAGITEVGIVVGDRGDQFRRILGDGRDMGLRITYIEQERPDGLAHCVLIAREFLGSDDFLMCLGDNVVLEGVGQLVSEFRSNRADAMLLLGKVDDPSEYGVAVVDDAGRIQRLVEKPETYVGDLAVVGAYVFSPAIHGAVRAIGPSARGELEITEAIQWLVDTGRRVVGHECPGYWKDAGRLTDLLACNRVLLERLTTDITGQVDEESTIRGPVVVAENATVSGSELVGPVLVAAGAVVRDSKLGPHTAVGPGCRITEAEIADSILLADATVHGVSGLSGSVVGRSASVRGGGAGAEVFLGDDSSVVIAS